MEMLQDELLCSVKQIAVTTCEFKVLAWQCCYNFYVQIFSAQKFATWAEIAQKSPRQQPALIGKNSKWNMIKQSDFSWQVFETI